MEQSKKGYDWGLVKRLTPYLKKYQLLLLSLVIVTLFVGAFNVFQPYMIKVGIDRDIVAGDYQSLKTTGIILLVVMVLNLLFQVVYGYGVFYLGQKLLYDLRLDLFKHLLKLSNNYFDKTPVGNTLTYVTGDVQAVRDFISDGVTTVISEILKLVFILIAMCLVNLKLALLTFLTVPFFILSTIVFRKSLRSGFRGVRKETSRINSILVETISGIREIIQFNFKSNTSQVFKEANKSYLKEYLKVVHAYSLYFPILEVVSNASLLIILIYAHNALGISLKVGEIFAFFFYINMFFRPLRHLAEKFNMFQSAMAAAERIFQFLDEKVEVKNSSSLSNALSKSNFKGEIQFDRVNFGYLPGDRVLKDLSFCIKPGEKVAIVGATGSGKTTLINLLNRMYDVNSGTIKIDGKDVRDIDLFELRKKIATVLQDPFIFTGTIAENISLHDPQVPMEEIVTAAKKVFAHHFIKNLPGQYQESVLEEGRRLSEGQNQLLSFARAFIRHPGIIILDEATSNIDSETERLIEAAIENLLKNRTAIIIAHRLSTIRKVDRIMVLHKGKLVEEGNHGELLRLGGIYSKLYNTQALLTN